MRIGEFGKAPIKGRTLVILCAYRGGVEQRAPWSCPSMNDWVGRILAAGVNLVTLRRLRVFIAQMRDHYANPRPYATQVEIARTALQGSAATSISAVIDIFLRVDGAEPLPFDPAPTVLPLARSIPSLTGIDSVLLVYPDPLGLGFADLEHRIISSGVRYVLIANGRRRLFPLTERARRALRWRRFLADTRLVEVGMAVIIVPLSALFAVADWTRRVAK